MLLRKVDKIARTILGKSLRKHEFYDFENKINKKTYKNFKRNYSTSLSSYPKSMIKQEYKGLRDKIIKDFKDSMKLKKTSLFFYQPSFKKAIGTYSAFKSIIEGLNHIGVHSSFFSLDDTNTIKSKINETNIIFFELKHILENKHVTLKKELSGNFKIGVAIHPNDDKNYINQLKELYTSGNVDFFYTFSSREYIELTYSYLLESNIPILDMEFGANPQIHYPIDVDKEYDYIFLGSTNRRKWDRYFKFFSNIFTNYYGFIAGPGWTKFFVKNKPFEVDSHLYSRAKVGLNLSVPSQLGVPRELNERTYQLAACGVIQLIDNPTLLFNRFPEDSIISCKTEKDYNIQFENIISGKIETKAIIDKAYDVVMNNHTIYHRAKSLIDSFIEVGVIDE